MFGLGRAIEGRGARATLILTLALVGGFAFTSGTARGAVAFDGAWDGIENSNPAQPAGLALAPDGTVYLGNDERSAIRHFSADGAPIGRFRVKSGWINDLAVAPDGSIYVVSGTSVERYSATGRLIGTWNPHGGEETPALSGAEGIAVAADGTVFATGSDTKGVLHMTAGGRLIKQFGPKSGFGTFRGLGDVAVAPDGSVYATEPDRYKVFHYTAEGKLLGSWGEKGWRPGQFDFGDAISVDDSGAVYVVDSGIWRVQKFDSEGRFLDQWGSGGKGNGRFLYPDGIAAGDGLVYVTDSSGRIQRFTTDDAPAVPAAALLPYPESWNNRVSPGKTITIGIRITNYGTADAKGVFICPQRVGFAASLFAGGTACRSIGTVPAMTGEVRQRFRIRAPKNQSRRGTYIRFWVRSDNGGGGPTATQVAIRRRPR